VYLTVKSSSSAGGAAGGAWQLPRAVLQPEEFLGPAAERACSLVANDMPRLWHFKRQPIGHLWRAYDQATIDAKGGGVFGRS
jgi:hypothetical protein